MEARGTVRTAIISDIHGNLEALEMVFTRLETTGVERVVCLGDIVGYNADPAACVALVRERCSAVVQGNHERMVLGRGLEGVHRATRAAIAWTREQLDAEAIAWIASLPEQLELEGGLLLVHGSPRDPDEYLLGPAAVRASYAFLLEHHPHVRRCFFGHTHLPIVAAPPAPVLSFHESRSVEIDRERLAMINPGSVGQPRDGSPLAAYAVYDDETHTVTIHRSAYPIVRAQQKVRAAGLNERFARRLARGR